MYLYGWSLYFLEHIYLRWFINLSILKPNLIIMIILKIYLLSFKLLIIINTYLMKNIFKYTYSF